VRSPRSDDDDRPSIAIEALKIAPQLLWFGLAVVVIIVLFKPIKTYIDKGEISKISIAAVQVEFSKAAPGVFSSPEQFAPYADRIGRDADLLSGAKSLWVDSLNPTENFQQRRALEALGISFDLAKNNQEANALLDLADKNGSPYDFIISNMRDKTVDPDVGPCFPKVSPEYQDAACKLIGEIRARYPDRPPPIILYSGDVRGVPEGALGATDQGFRGLILLVLDAVERRKVDNHS